VNLVSPYLVYKIEHSTKPGSPSPLCYKYNRFIDYDFRQVRDDDHGDFVAGSSLAMMVRFK